MEVQPNLVREVLIQRMKSKSRTKNQKMEILLLLAVMAVTLVQALEAAAGPARRGLVRPVRVPVAVQVRGLVQAVGKAVRQKSQKLISLLKRK